jgi:guanine deaminase
VQTHIAENRDEVKFIASLFPERKDFLDVYDHYGLVGRRAVLGHGIWLSDSELSRCHEREASIAHCPTSNLFLCSGLFPVRHAKDPKRPIHVGLGTDVGAGTSFSLLATLNEAYKISELLNAPIGAPEGLYLATLGGARALDLEDRLAPSGSTARPGSRRRCSCWCSSATITTCAPPISQGSLPMRVNRLTLEASGSMVRP